MERKENPIHEILVSTLDKFKNIASVDSVVGSPISLADGTTLIPVSKISAGFVSGGGEYDAKNAKSDQGYPFSGGGGSGYCVHPMGFVAIRFGQVKMITIDGKNSFDKIVQMIPDIISSVMEGKKWKKFY